MKKQKVVIIGAGSQARIVFDILKSQNKYDVAFFIEVCNNKSLWKTKIRDIEVLGGADKIEDIKKKKIKFFIVAFGDNKRRAELFKMAKENSLVAINAIHKSAIISKFAQIGEGCTISPKVIINCDAKIGNNVILNTGAIIEHDCIIGDNAHIASNVALAGHVEVGRNTLIGIGAKVIQGIKIGENVTIGAGAVVIENIPPNVTAVGIPAKIKNRK